MVALPVGELCVPRARRFGHVRHEQRRIGRGARDGDQRRRTADDPIRDLEDHRPPPSPSDAGRSAPVASTSATLRASIRRGDRGRGREASRGRRAGRAPRVRALRAPRHFRARHPVTHKHRRSPRHGPSRARMKTRSRQSGRDVRDAARFNRAIVRRSTSAIETRALRTFSARSAARAASVSRAAAMGERTPDVETSTSRLTRARVRDGGGRRETRARAARPRFRPRTRERCRERAGDEPRRGL